MNLVDASTNTVDPIEGKKCRYLWEAIGWSGSVFVLTAYLVTMNPELYVILNCVGATGVGAICFVKKAYQSAVVNCIWVIGGVIRYYTNFP